jgi:hypothetical protein
MTKAGMAAQGYELATRVADIQEDQLALLEQIASESGVGLQTLAVTEDAVNAGIEVDFPIEGGKRWIIPRKAIGGKLAIPTSITSVLPSNNRRLGGAIVNIGEKPASIFLASALDAGSQQGLGLIWLRGEGGSWDFRVGSLLWCGSICAIAEGGATTFAVAEV